MTYEKSYLSALGGPVVRTDGDSALACVDGVSAGTWQSCGDGGAATWSCIAGGSPSSYVSCFGGVSARVGGDCPSGSDVAYYCENGADGSNDSCEMGPSYVFG